LCIALAVCACYPTYIFDLAEQDKGAGGGRSGGGGAGGRGGASGGGGRGGSGSAANPDARKVEIRFNPASPVLLTNVPVMVMLDPDSGRIDYSRTQDHGEDIRFFDADDTTPLMHEIERWDETGPSFVWVLVPKIGGPNASEQRIWMHFGDPTTKDGQHPHDVWPGYTAVYHFADNAPPGDLAVHDSVGASDGVAQMLGKANFANDQLKLDGTPGQGIVVPPSAAVTPEPNSARTMELWFERAGAKTEGVLFTMQTCCMGWSLATTKDTPPNVIANFGTNTCCGRHPDDSKTLSQPIPSSSGDTEPHYLVTSFDRVAGVMRLYLDGMEAQEVPIDTMAGLPSIPGMIGGGGHGMAPFSGNIDEVRIAMGASSPDWVLTQYRSMTDDLLTFGAIQPAK
jgi:hypothetical protein